MCKWGNTKPVAVRIPVDLSCTGHAIMKIKKIDSCIASIIDALQKGKIDMRSSCCGHGKGIGQIALQDGRFLMIINPDI